jgi:hypothetical protein
MIYFDFEYNDTQVILCCIRQTFKEERDDYYDAFDLRGELESKRLFSFIDENINDIFVSFALSAEINSLLRLGYDTSKMKCIDLIVECKMISMSHKDYFVPMGNLIGHLDKFLNIDVTTLSEVKDKTRDLIIYQNEWTNEQWEDIVKYCFTDVEPLRDLFGKCIEIHKQVNHPYMVSACLSRGDYVRMSAEMDFASKGFPVNVDAVNKIFANKDKIKKLIVNQIPSFAIRNCYVLNKKGGFTFSRKRFAELVDANNWTWDLTENGLPCLDIAYIEKMEAKYPSVEHLRRAQKSLVTMNSADLREQLKGNYIKPKTFAYSAKTSRNGLKPKQGYLLNLPSWMRRIIKPEEGYVLVGVDYSQQEIAIAASLSNDQKMIDAYNSGDLYLALGKMAGHIPESGTKETHKMERELFKALQLALGYGKGIKSLGLDFKRVMHSENITDLEAQLLAKGIYEWHKSYFSDYWRWIEEEVKQARLNNWIETLDNWVCFVNSKSMRTQLLNFPSQSNGATLLRLATKKLYNAYKEGVIPALLCSQHDAFYFNLKESEVERCVPKIKKLMIEASEEMLGLTVRVSTKIYNSSEGYIPEKITTNQRELWDLVVSLENSEI